MAEPEPQAAQPNVPAPNRESWQSRIERNFALFVLGLLLSGFLGGYKAADVLICSPVPSPLLTITRVELVEGTPAVDGYRLTVTVNDDQYSFPTDQLWDDLGSATKNGRIRIHPAKKYKASMRAWVRRAGVEEEISSSQSEMIEPGRSGVFNLGSLKIKFDLE